MFKKEIFERRINALKSYMEKEKIDASILMNPANLNYFSGVTFYYQTLAVSAGTIAVLLISRNSSPIYILNVDDVQRVKKRFSIGDIHKYEKPGEFLSAFLSVVDTIGPKSENMCLGVEGAYLPAKIYSKLSKKTRKIEDISEAILDLRAKKDKNELELMKKAADIADRGMEAAFKNISSDRKESEIAAYCDYVMKQKGADDISFKTIIASGKNTSLASWVTSDDYIKKGYPVIVDLGAVCKGYRSDTTRTFTYNISKKQRELLKAVIEIEELAIERLEIGMPQYKLDDIVQGEAKKRGYKKYFFHVSHGIGLEPVEKPRIAMRSKEKIQEGMVTTIEVGIYVPSLGGARMEDVIYINKKGALPLTVFPRELDKLTIT